MKALSIGRQHWCLRKEGKMAAVMIGIIWAQEHIAYLLLCPSLLCTVCNEHRKKERQTQREETGFSSLWHCLCVWRRGLCVVRSATPLWQCQKEVVVVVGEFDGSRPCWQAVVPAFSSTIWSFWHSSMKPSMRLANSTTYWMASVILIAHSCHMTSRG